MICWISGGSAGVRSAPVFLWTEISAGCSESVSPSIQSEQTDPEPVLSTFRRQKSRAASDFPQASGATEWEKFACRGSLDLQTRRRHYYFETPADTRPRYFSMGSMLGGPPCHASYILPRSSVLPRDSTICRKRSPFARVSPPCSSNHW